MITTLKTILNSDGTKHRTGSAREISVIVKGNPVKQVKVGVADIKSNYNVENGFVRRYNSFEYGTTDLVNTYASVEKNSYIHSQNINENFDANNIISTRLNRDGYHESLNSRLYTIYYTSASYPNTGDWPSPVFLKTAQTTKNGNQLVIGTKGSIIKFYDNSTYSGDPIYQATVDGNITAVYNLQPKITYYYKVLDSSDNILFSGSFTTDGNTRFTRLAQVHNVRDCGGWKTIDGSKRFKYGLIFRGGQFNSGFYNNPTSQSLTKVANELKQLDITQTINFRGDDYETNVSNAFGNDITMTKIGSNNNFDFANLYNNTTVINHFLNSLRIVVNTLQQNKSVYVHCQQGRDRTGGFISVLEALCDISENGIVKDYELTSSATQVTTRSTFQEMWTGFKNGYSNSTYPTIQSKIQKWFIDKYNALTANTYRIKDSNGNYITDGQTALNTVKELMLEDIPVKDRTIGVIGDSYSAYQTWKPVLSETYRYTGEFPCTDETESRDDVKSPTQMWWYKVASNLGMVPETQLSLAAWSGTCVSDLQYLSKLRDESLPIVERSMSSTTFLQDARPASSPQRIKHLSNKFGGLAPDIIICEIGMNDARKIGSSYGNIQVTTQYISNYYKQMLDNIISQYPKAKIFCLTPVNLSTAYVSYFNQWKPVLTTLIEQYPQVTLIDISDAFTESGTIKTGKYTIHDDTHPNAAGNTRIANIVSAAISDYYQNSQPDPQPQEDEVYITQINDDSFTGTPAINGGVFTWPLNVTLSDGTVTTYANYRANHSNYGDAFSEITGDNAKAPNEGYIDSNGNLTYDLSKDNYVLDSTYLGTVTLPCLTNSSNTVTKQFSKIQKCVIANNSTPFDSYISNDYTFTSVSSYELSYHASSGSDPDVGTFEISNWPQSEKDDYSSYHCTKEIPKNCIIRITNSYSGPVLNNIIVLNTDVKLDLKTWGTANGIFTDTSSNGTYKANVYSRSSYSDTGNNCKCIRILRNQKAYIRNTTTRTYSYLVVFGRDDQNCLIEIGEPKASN